MPMKQSCAQNGMFILLMTARAQMYAMEAANAVIL